MVPSEFIVNKKEGGQVDLEIFAILVKIKDQNVILGIGRNITQRKKEEKEKRKLEEQLRQAQKMEAIGRLTGGVAHDFNNLLTTIIGNTELALMDIEKDNPLYEELEEIQKAGKSAASLTRQLLAFSRKQILTPEIINLNELIMNLEKMLKRIIGEDVNLEIAVVDDLGNVEVDAGQMEQVIMNLAVNARDAMPRGGDLTIETASVTLDESYFKNRGVQNAPGLYVMLAISDTGIGMDKETKARIFDPFFTTKEMGKGTGLGLSTVYGIVKQSNGLVWVYSEPGEGTTFKIYFPRILQDAISLQNKQVSADVPRGSETVLIAEDSDTLRKLARRILQMQGYKVLDAGNGEEALKIAEEYKNPIHLLLTDVVMPKMSGRDLAENIHAFRPEVKVLYMSGYTDNSIIHHGILRKETAFIQKPFTPDVLARKVREILA